MLPEKEKKRVLEELSKYRKEVRDLRDSLNKINDEKESWFQKKKENSYLDFPELELDRKAQDK